MDPLTGEYADLAPFLYAENDSISNLDVEGMAAGDFNIVDPPTKRLPTVNNTRSTRTPDPHKVAEGGRILSGVFKFARLASNTLPIVRVLSMAFEPATLGTGDIPQPKFVDYGKILKNTYEHAVTDPANDLTPEEKTALEQRIKLGMASENDKFVYNMMKLKNAPLVPPVKGQFLFRGSMSDRSDKFLNRFMDKETNYDLWEASMMRLNG